MGLDFFTIERQINRVTALWLTQLSAPWRQRNLMLTQVLTVKHVQNREKWKLNDADDDDDDSSFFSAYISCFN